MTYNLLFELTPASKQWHICARVSRLWEYCGNVDGNTIQHLDLVLVDAQVIISIFDSLFISFYSLIQLHICSLLNNTFLLQGNTIYGEVPKEHVEAKKDQLQAGHVYAFSRFLVYPNKEKYRAVDTDYMIQLTYYT